MVGFNYRRVPAIALARRLVEQGRIGALRHVRAVYLQDWLVDPDSPLTWRLQAEQAGSGALGDLGSHVVDLARFLTGDEIVGVSALSATFIDQRPLPGGSRDVDARSDRDGDATGTGDARDRDASEDRRPRAGRDGSRSMTRWSSPPGSDQARWARSRRPGAPRAGRTRCGSSSTARPAASRSTWSDSTSSSSTTAPTPADRGLPPDPRHRGRAPLPVRLVAAGSHHRLGAHVHASGQGPADRDRGGRAAAALVRRRAGRAAGA